MTPILARLLVLPALLIAAAALFFLPELSPRSTLFGVRVPAGFRASETARGAIHTHRIWVLLALLVSVLLELFASPSIAFWMPPIVVAAAGMASFSLRFRQLKPFAAEPEAVERSVELTADRMPRYAWLAAAALAVMCGTALYLALHWDAIPQRWPIHWGANGRPNGWSTKSVRGVFGPLVFGGSFCVWAIVLELAVWYGSRRSQYRQLVVLAMTSLSIMFGILWPAIALQPLLQFPPALLTIGTMAMVILMVLIVFGKTMAINNQPTAERDLTSDAAWSGGMLYFNRQDPALFVPKRAGSGFVPNLAHPVAWFVFLAPFAIVFAAMRWLW